MKGIGSPLVSICCITFNHASYIRQCLDGFLMQETDFAFEVLIHDDASTDDTADIIREYESKYPDIIKPIYQTENQWVKGRRGSVIFNFPRAKGKYIALCEGDDYWTDPLKLQKQVDFLDNNPNVVLCCHEIKRVNQNGIFFEKAKINDNIIKYSSLEMLHKSFRPLSMAFRNIDLNYSDKLFEAPHGDVVLIALLSKHGSAVTLDFIGGNYRVHEGGVYSSISYYNKIKNSILSRRVLLESETLSLRQQREVRKVVVNLKVKFIKYALKRLSPMQAIKILFI